MCKQMENLKTRAFLRGGILTLIDLVEDGFLRDGVRPHKQRPAVSPGAVAS